MAIDKEAFLMYLSTFCDEFPSIVSQFEKIYIEDKERFYTKACKSSYYNHPSLTEGSLLIDVTHKRIFGILLAAEEDEILYKRICDMFCTIDKDFKTCIEAPTQENFLKLVQKLQAYKAYDKRNFLIYALAYCMMADGTLQTPQAEFVLMCLSTDLDVRNHYHPERLHDIVEKINPFDYLELDANSWKVIKQITSSTDILTIAGLMNAFLNPDETDDLANQSLIMEFKKSYQNKEAYTNGGWEKLIQFTKAFLTMADYYGISVRKLLEGVKVTKADQQFVLKMLAFNNQQLSTIYKSRTGQKFEVQSSINIYDYYTALILYLFIKNFLETKNFYFENNNETLFSQVSAYREKNEQLASELAAAKQKIAEEQAKVELLRQQIEALNQSTAKEAKAQFKPYIEEISSLTKQVETLEEELVVERAKAPELNALREFAFSVRSEYIPEDKDIKLEDLLSDKKLVILGGHIEWRNKLKKKFPSIITLDGHNSGADFSVLSNASLVLLNTSNMSHSVYYKAIDILRNGSVPFDYLGRFINQDLFEKEVIALIQKHNI